MPSTPDMETTKVSVDGGVDKETEIWRDRILLCLKKGDTEVFNKADEPGGRMQSLTFHIKGWGGVQLDKAVHWTEQGVLAEARGT